ncbi:MAG: hypothetical protein IKB22_05795 [Lentisphaeria bacterium]|nr:hypothetical protein [Lentisphaeria bacterium]
MTYAPFNELRTQVEKQYENVVFVPESGGSETELRRAWENHKNENPAEDRRVPLRQAEGLV